MKGKRFVFVSSFGYPSRFAHALHGLHMARVFSKRFADRFLFFVNVAEAGALEDVPHRLLFGQLGRSIKKLRLRRIFLPFVLAFFFFRNRSWRGPNTILYTTDPALFGLCAWLKRLFGLSLVVECHGTLTPRQVRVLDKVDLAVFVTEGLRSEYVASARKAITVPNAVDMAAFSAVQDDKHALREKLGLPRDATLVGYIGRFEPLGYDKGLRLMFDALAELSSVRMVLVGGAKKEVEAYEKYARERRIDARVRIVGHVDPVRVPEYAKACDILAYVPSEKNEFFGRQTSPMKLFEYMAAGRPIVVSDTPAMREVLGPDEAFFVEQGSLQAFTDAIRAIHDDPKEAERRAQTALKHVQTNTWEQRVQRIVSSL